MMSSRHFRNGFASSLSDSAKMALKDLEAIGYDIDALARRGMNSEQIKELRDKAYRYRGIEIPTPISRKRMDDLVTLFWLGVELALNTTPARGKVIASHVLYLAESQLSES
jgi:hypothetical protein